MEGAHRANGVTPPSALADWNSPFHAFLSSPVSLIHH
jgi:hypothetical protein